MHNVLSYRYNADHTAHCKSQQHIYPSSFPILHVRRKDRRRWASPIRLSSSAKRELRSCLVGGFSITLSPSASIALLSLGVPVASPSPAPVVATLSLLTLVVSPAPIASPATTSATSIASSAVIVLLQCDGSEGVLVKGPLFARGQSSLPAAVPIESGTREGIEKVVLVVTCFHRSSIFCLLLCHFCKHLRFLRNFFSTIKIY